MAGNRKLGRTTAHRNLMLRGLVTYLLENGQIETTHKRAKEVSALADKMITLGKEGTKNGTFADVEKTKSGRKNILSATFPKYWGFAGTKAVFDEKKAALFLDGVIYQFMGVSGGPKGGILKVEVKASSVDGKGGSIRPYLSLCVRKPDDRGGFRHDVKKFGSRINVTKSALYNFAFELAPYENGYIYLEGHNVQLESISAAFEEKR